MSNVRPEDGDDAEGSVGQEHAQDDEPHRPGRLRLLQEGHRGPSGKAMYVAGKCHINKGPLLDERYKLDQITRNRPDCIVLVL